MGRFGKTSKHAGKVQTANTGKSDIAIMKNKHTTTPSQSIHPTKSQIKPSHPKVYRPNTSIVANPNKYPEKGANFGASYGVQTGNPRTHEVQQRTRHHTVTAAKTIMGFPAAVVDKMGNLIPASNAAEAKGVGSVQAGLNAQMHKDKYGNIINKKGKNKYQNISSEQEFNPFGL